MQGCLYVFFPLLDKCQLKASTNTTCDISPLLKAIAQLADAEVDRNKIRCFERHCIGEYDVLYHGADEFDQQADTRRASLYLSTPEAMDFSVLTLVVPFGDTPPLQLLDRVMRQDVQLNIAGQCQPLTSLLNGCQLGTPKILCSVSEQPSAQALPYWFACEAMASDSVAGASITPSFEGGIWQENIGVYDSSAIYAGKNLLMRVDGLPKSQTERMQRDAMLLYIVEVLVAKDTSLQVANIYFSRVFGDHRKVNDIALREAVDRYKCALEFSDLNGFYYPTSRCLAQCIQQKLAFHEQQEIYERNKQYLEDRSQIEKSIKADKENQLLMMIALIVFFVDGVPFLYKVMHWLSVGTFDRQQLIPGVASLLLFVLIFTYLMVRNRQGNGRGFSEHRRD